jgi:uncharacterized protein (TIGR02598 family)
MKNRKLFPVVAVYDRRNLDLSTALIERRYKAFSLAEVVVALGVISFAIVAILGVLPTGLQSGKSSQDETRATQIAQTIFASVSSQASVQFDNVNLLLNDNRTNVAFHLSGSEAIPAFYADNLGKLTGDATEANYQITITTNSAPAGFDAGNANQVTIHVAWPAKAPAAAQTSRDYIQIISKF